MIDNNDKELIQEATQQVIDILDNMLRRLHDGKADKPRSN